MTFKSEFAYVSAVVLSFSLGAAAWLAVFSAGIVGVGLLNGSEISAFAGVLVGGVALFLAALLIKLLLWLVAERFRPTYMPQNFLDQSQYLDRHDDVSKFHPHDHHLMNPMWADPRMQHRPNAHTLHHLD